MFESFAGAEGGAVTVGEKIGGAPMSYAQGTAAQLVTAGTILAADVAGAPVSTTHVLSSAVAGGMAAGGSGLQPDTLRNVALAWLLTLPASLFLAFRALLESQERGPRREDAPVAAFSGSTRRRFARAARHSPRPEVPRPR